MFLQPEPVVSPWGLLSRVAQVVRDQQRDRKKLNGEVRAMGHGATKGRV